MKTFKCLLIAVAGLALAACSDDSDSDLTKTETSSSSAEETSSAAVAVDYTAGRTMNARLGRGINMGNSWDSKHSSYDADDGTYNYGGTDNLDANWSNPIDDSYFQIVADAGFNSIRLPVRWQHNSNPETHTVSDERLAGVKEDVQLAIDAGLAVILDFHHYEELMTAASNYTTDTEAYEAEKLHFVSLWNQISAEFESFPDSLLVYDLLNEPQFSSTDALNDLLLSAYAVVRANSPGKTIMFESKEYAKLYNIDDLTLPEDGNIIFSGHYYEPYKFTHQGSGYDCDGDDAYDVTVSSDFLEYITLAQSLYPDVNGGYIPINVGEFGVAGSTSSCGSDAPSETKRILWTKKVITAAEKYDMSWHYWDFANASGFEIFDTDTETWFSGFIENMISDD